MVIAARGFAPNRHCPSHFGGHRPPTPSPIPWYGAARRAPHRDIATRAGDRPFQAERGVLAAWAENSQDPNGQCCSNEQAKSNGMSPTHLA